MSLPREVVSVSSRPTRHDRVLSESTDRATVLLAVDSGGYYELTEVGALVWDACDGSRTVADIVELVVATYDAPAETVLSDVRELLDDLVREELLLLG